jgi:CBS-domain-containing membrane protein
MTLLDKPLQSLTAEDLMSHEVLTIPRGMSLRGAAQLLMRAQVSGAPIVDEGGRCVGVLSTSDFLKLAGDVPAGQSFLAHVACDWQVFELEAVPEDSVEQHMTADPVTVLRETTLGELARRMVDAHIHRVIVVDEEQRPVGVVSTTDVLSAVAQDAR